MVRVNGKSFSITVGRDVDIYAFSTCQRPTNGTEVLLRLCCFVMVWPKGLK